MARGGKRLGAGRPRKPESTQGTDAGTAARKRPSKDQASVTPLEYLLGVMNDATASDDRRDRAAVSAAQYVHAKRHSGGIKDDRTEKAKQAVKQDPFAPGAPPRRLAAVPRPPR